MAYGPRPGASPVVATLLAAGLLRPGMRALDVGCGAGVDAVALARHGLRVTGLDLDRRALASARRRARRAGVAAEAVFIEGDVLAMPPELRRGRFDVVVDTLLFNNVRDDEVAAYAREVAAALRPRGLLALAERVTARAWRAGGVAARPPATLRRRFTFGPTVSTALAEPPLGPHDPPYARVAVSVGTRR